MSIKEIARQTGLSASTVSRYLRGQLKVQSETAEKIHQAAVSLGVIDATGREIHRIACIIPELTNPFYATLAEYMTTIAAAENRHIDVLLSNGQLGREQQLVEYVRSDNRFDGLIYAGIHYENKSLTKLLNEGFPVVIVDERIDLSNVKESKHPSFIGVDNYSGAYQATMHLISLGHQRIAHVSGPTELFTTQERMRGYKDAVTFSGLPFDSSIIFNGPYAAQFGASILPYLITDKHRPTAIFIGSDIVAAGVMSTAERYGLKVPEDISIVGCDGIHLGQWLRPQLSTLEQPVEDLARLALQTLVARRKNLQITLPMTLVIRTSSVSLNKKISN